MVIPFLAQEISGIATQAYNSGAVNRKFINDVSSAIWTEFDGLSTFNSDDYITSSNAIERFVGSSQYQTDKTSWQAAYDWYNASSQGLSTHENDGDLHVTAAEKTDWQDTHDSGTKYTAAYDWFIASSQGLSTHENDGDLHVTAAEKVAWEDTHTSGLKYTAAYDWFIASSQKLSKKSGWHTGPDGDTITHDLDAVPTSIIIQPSGAITFATGFDTVTATQLNMRISAAGSRTVSWRVEV